MQLSGTSRFTTDPAATIQFFPMVTPPQIVALEQIQLPLPMWIGFASVSYTHLTLPTNFPVIHVCFSFFLISSLILLSPEMSAHFLL